MSDKLKDENKLAFKKEKLLKIFEKILIFIGLILLLVISDVPMNIYSLIKNPTNFDLYLVYLNLIVDLLIILIINKLEDRASRTKGYWHEESRKISLRWILILLVFLIIFALVTGLIDRIMESFTLFESNNQRIINEEIKNFPVKIWLYFNLGLQAPIIEEYIFRKGFNALFFRKDTKTNNVLASFNIFYNICTFA